MESLVAILFTYYRGYLTERRMLPNSKFEVPPGFVKGCKKFVNGCKKISEHFSLSQQILNMFNISLRIHFPQTVAGVCKTVVSLCTRL